MKKEEKTTHLENIKSIVYDMYVNESNIYKLSEIMNKELRNEENSEIGNKVYIFHLKETIKKELNKLINSRKNHKNRISEFKDARDNFIQDINRYLGDLRQS